jgi:hypothetical protein
LVKVRLEADFDDFEHVVFYRRACAPVRSRSSDGSGCAAKNITFTNYGKVLVYVKFKDAAHFEAQGKDVDDLPFTPGSTIIKLFQDVPRADLEMLFPNARVRMRRDRQAADRGSRGRLRDHRGRHRSSIAALLPGRCCWLLVRRAQGTGRAQPGQLVALGAALAAVGGFLVRQFGKFKNRKIQFMKSLSDQPLLPQSRQRRRRVQPLARRAEEEEVKEAVLRLPLPAQRRGCAHRRRAGRADSRPGSPAAGAPSSTSRWPTACAKLRRLRAGRRPEGGLEASRSWRPPAAWTRPGTTSSPTTTSPRPAGV